MHAAVCPLPFLSASTASVGSLPGPQPASLRGAFPGTRRPERTPPDGTLHLDPGPVQDRGRRAGGGVGERHPPRTGRADLPNPPAYRTTCARARHRLGRRGRAGLAHPPALHSGWTTERPSPVGCKLTGWPPRHTLGSGAPEPDMTLLEMASGRRVTAGSVRSVPWASGCGRSSQAARSSTRSPPCWPASQQRYGPDGWWPDVHVTAPV